LNALDLGKTWVEFTFNNMSAILLYMNVGNPAATQNLKYNLIRSMSIMKACTHQISTTNITNTVHLRAFSLKLGYSLGHQLVHSWN
jgi:hypothetical protein